jgi:hypothetical protein
VLAGSIVSVQAQKRVSAEFIGFAGLIVACVAVAVLSRSGGVAAGALCLSAILALGAAREITHPYVLVLEIFQMGTFEARGFTRDAIAEALGAVEDLRAEGSWRGGASGRGVGQAAGESSF